MNSYFKPGIRIAIVVAIFVAGSPAHANVGLPMLYLVWPAMWMLLLPIIVVEAAVATKILHVDFIQAIQIAGVANLLSTLVGIPVTWILLLAAELRLGKGGEAYGLDTTLGKILSVTLQSPWLLPYEEKWLVPAAELFLCLPFFLMSVWIEYISAKAYTQGRLPVEALLSWSWQANALSYSLIAATLTIILLRALKQKNQREKKGGADLAALLLSIEPLRNLAEQAAFGGIAIAAFIAYGPTGPRPKKPKALHEIGIFACSCCKRGARLLIEGKQSAICAKCLGTFADRFLEHPADETDSVTCTFCSGLPVAKTTSRNIRICSKCVEWGQQMIESAKRGEPISDSRGKLSLVTAPAPLSNVLLNTYLNSKRVECVREWLFLIRDYEVAKEYSFSTNFHRELCSESLLQDLHQTMEETVNPHFVGMLSKGLRGRSDDKTVELMIQLLSTDDAGIRSDIAFSLQESSSTKLEAALPRFIRDKSLRTTNLTKCAIVNKLDQLHDAYEEFLNPDSDKFWRQSALDYFAAFPRDRDRNLFRTILETEESTSLKSSAALGLANLCDTSSVALIIETMQKESSESNRRDYLEALAKIKGEKAKEAVKLYRKSSDEYIRKVVAKLLRKW